MPDRAFRLRVPSFRKESPSEDGYPATPESAAGYPKS